MTDHHVTRARRSRAVQVAVLALGIVGASVLTGSAASSPVVSTFVPITPCRLIDTRPATQVGPRNTPLAAQSAYTVPVWGLNGACDIPATATGVSMNVAIVNPTGNSFLTVYPADASNPGTANLNWVAGQAPTPNAVTSALSADGKLAFFNYAGTVDIAADVVGYYTPGAQGPKGDTGSTGPAGATGATGARGPVAPRNRITNAQIALGQWWLDPGRAATFSMTNPTGMAFDGTNVWVANLSADTVTKVDSATGATLATVAVGDQPRAIVYDGANMWVANAGSNSVSKISIATNQVVATYSTTGLGPWAIVFDGTYVWTTDRTTHGLTRIAAASGTVTGPYPAGTTPSGIAYDGTSLWVTSTGTDQVRVMDPATGALQATVTVGTTPYGIAYDGTNMWVANLDSHDVTKIDVATRTAVDSTSAGALGPTAQPFGVAYDGHVVWVGSLTTNTVSEIDPGNAEVLSTWPVAAAPYGLVFDGLAVWVGSRDGNKITRFHRV